MKVRQRQALRLNAVVFRMDAPDLGNDAVSPQVSRLLDELLLLGD